MIKIPQKKKKVLLKNVKLMKPNIIQSNDVKINQKPMYI